MKLAAYLGRENIQLRVRLSSIATSRAMTQCLAGFQEGIILIEMAYRSRRHRAGALIRP
jgi:hypothetical protein